MSSSEVNALFASAVANQEINNKTEEAKSGGARGWLRAIATATGALADAKAAAMDKKIQGLTADSPPSAMLDTQTDVSEFQLMMNTFTNVVKSVGESISNAARKG